MASLRTCSLRFSSISGPSLKLHAPERYPAAGATSGLSFPSSRSGAPTPNLSCLRSPGSPVPRWTSSTSICGQTGPTTKGLFVSAHKRVGDRDARKTPPNGLRRSRVSQQKMNAARQFPKRGLGATFAQTRMRDTASRKQTGPKTRLSGYPCFSTKPHRCCQRNSSSRCRGAP